MRADACLLTGAYMSVSPHATRRMVETDSVVYVTACALDATAKLQCHASAP